MTNSSMLWSIHYNYNHMPSSTTARKYSTIWAALKSKGVCVIAAPIPLHARFIKGTITEKNKDVAYKILQAEEGKRSVIHYETEGSKVTFKLTVHSKVRVEDL